MRLRISSVGAAVLFASLACAQGTPDGHWEGSFTMNERQIGLSLDLAKNVNGEWIASMGVPAAKATGLVVMDIAVSGKAVKFVAVELGMSKFELNLGANGTMAGTVSGPQGQKPVEFKRTGEAKVELIPASPAVSNRLEGDWAGTIQTPGGRALEIIVHFKNQPDKTVRATIDTPDSGAMGLPLNDVKETGQNVAFGLKVAHGRFEGTLNEQGTELAGELRHEETGLPLTLRKK